MAFPTHRPRRLRATPALRRLVAETTLRPRQLVLPMFVKEGATEPTPIASMPGVVQHTRDSLRKAAAEAVDGRRRRADAVRRPRAAGTPPAPPASTRTASSTSRCATCAPRSATTPCSWPTLCLDEFTDHGHCGVLDADGAVDNDATLARLRARWLWRRPTPARTWSGPSGMMDGQVGVDPRGAGRRRAPRHRRSWPTPPSTRRRSTARSARPSSRQLQRRPARPTSRTRPTPARRCARSRWTSPRAPTW